MGGKCQKYLVNLFQRKQCWAPLHSMRRGFVMPSRKEFRHKKQTRKD